MDWNKETINTYDKSADQLAAYFAGIGPRIDDIERAIKLTGRNSSDLNVVEIGCGNGRDAVEIANRVGKYEGFDPSNSLLELARQKLPETSFVKADALSYRYPPETDLYFAFASLLHVNYHDLSIVFDRVGCSLKRDGIIYISLKERPTYQEEVKVDKFGTRKFYYYNPAVIESIAGTDFVSTFEDHQVMGTTNWFTLGLRKA